MTWKQKRAVIELFNMLNETYDAVWLHHGDCEGADSQAHAEARRLGWNIHLHPPTDLKKRSFCDYDEKSKPRKYLDRNSDIVKRSSLMVATPKEDHEIIRSGTWSTVRKATAAKHDMFVIMPNGKARMT